MRVATVAEILRAFAVAGYTLTVDQAVGVRRFLVAWLPGFRA